MTKLSASADVCREAPAVIALSVFFGPAFLSELPPFAFATSAFAFCWLELSFELPSPCPWSRSLWASSCKICKMVSYSAPSVDQGPTSATVLRRRVFCLFHSENVVPYWDKWSVPKSYTLTCNRVMIMWFIFRHTAGISILPILYCIEENWSSHAYSGLTHPKHLIASTWNKMWRRMHRNFCTSRKTTKYQDVLRVTVFEADPRQESWKGATRRSNFYQTEKLFIGLWQYAVLGG